MQINNSVGICCVNDRVDVGVVQRLLYQKHPYFRRIISGNCDVSTINAIKLFQSSFMQMPNGRVDVNSETWRKLNNANYKVQITSFDNPESYSLLAGALATGVSAVAGAGSSGDSAGQSVGGPIAAGKVTYNAEGNDNSQSPYFSRVIHWPGGISGVTIGRGYDMGSRTETQVYNDMVSAGIGDAQAKKLSKGAGLSGSPASTFVTNNKQSIGQITKQQQINLFNQIYPGYVTRAKSNYDRWTTRYPERVLWDRLKPVIRDILVDFVYQGFTQGENPMKAGMNNDIDELIIYIEGNQTIKQYEAGRQRADYLRNNLT